ncbi:PREDICTED: trafficking protein particle complex subunit 2-like protein [Dipodomys ordii]|uniref:Trafficking protein particle complex subunit 2-like protein n=1 Tax=Dipodomys ordii TaxID=10020 RepID=A0A1S3EVU9_DIPOR|nr:PREDICTED: trafficking protein particle complex subunit 2-like protein [Dipodomys ordii]
MEPKRKAVHSRNYPLYIRSTPMENELKFHYMVHTSLDVIEEKISAMGKALVDQRELYLGLLYPTEDYKVYGYVTNSKVKFVMVVDSSNTALRDNEIRSMFRKLHNSYTDVMCNPFYNPGDRIQSRWAYSPYLAAAFCGGQSPAPQLQSGKAFYQIIADADGHLPSR